MNKIKLQIAGKIKCSTVNGNGIRYVLFLSGCPHHCEGCHSPHTWDYNYGKSEDIVDIFSDIYKNRHYIDGVTISGGEPVEQSENLKQLLKMLKIFNFNIWMWTGYKIEVLKSKDSELLEYLDTIIDSTFDINKPTEKPHRGSDNQRMWNKEDNKWKEE